jgi:hypothetical protein
VKDCRTRVFYGKGRSLFDSNNISVLEWLLDVEII